MAKQFPKCFSNVKANLDVEQLMCGKGESSLSGQGLPMALPLQLHSAADAVDAINQLVLFVDRADIFL